MKAITTHTAGVLVSLALSLAPASAGVVMEFSNSSHSGQSTKGSVWIMPDRLRTEQGGTVAIYRADKDLLWIVDEKKGEYTEMTREQMKKVGDTMAGAMAQMQEQLKNVPPEQRAMIEKMMAGKMPAAEQKPVEPIRFTKTGGSETINGYPCQAYAGNRAGKQVQELWVTDWKRLDLTAKDFAAFGLLSQFMKEGMGPMGKKFSSAFAQTFSDSASPDALPGVPIRIITPAKEGASVMEIEKIGREAIPASRFEVPSGFKKQELDGMKEPK